jgi:predicted house-cleaning noncanonical NTP pyrophosphatase (MazG superfamily)
MFKLIRDNIPALVEAEGNQLNVAAVQNDEFFLALLKNKLIEEVNEYLSSENSIEELVDIKTVLDYLIGNRQEEFNLVYDGKLKEHGGFEKRYIGFFADPSPEAAMNADTQTE